MSSERPTAEQEVWLRASASALEHVDYHYVRMTLAEIDALRAERDALTAELARVREERDAQFQRAEKNGVDWEKQVYRTQEVVCERDDAHAEADEACTALKAERLAHAETRRQLEEARDQLGTQEGISALREVSRGKAEAERARLREALTKKLDALERVSGLCDPDCEGRCELCPLDWIRDVRRLMSSNGEQGE